LCATVSILLAVVLILAVGLPDQSNFIGEALETGGRIAPQQGAIAPQLSFPAFEGDAIDLWGLRGDPVVVNFWATWCAPCRFEMPELQRLYDSYHEGGLQVLAVNLGESEDAILDWVMEFNLSVDILMDREGISEMLYRFPGPPATFVIAPDGKIVKVIYGPATMTEIQNALAPFLS
jgi:thiol-disulfide isomerase/thioredoxin